MQGFAARVLDRSPMPQRPARTFGRRKDDRLEDRRLPEVGLAEGVLDLAENRSFLGSGRPRGGF